MPLVDPDDPDTDPKAAALLRAAAEAGPLLNVQRALANHPDLMEAFFGLAEIAYFNGNLTPKEAELAYLTSAMAIDCFY